jgi:hypothetical protein
MAASLAAGGCVMADGLLLVTAAGSVVSGRWLPDGWLIVAIALSLVRLVTAATAGRRLSRLRAAGC